MTSALATMSAFHMLPHTFSRLRKISKETYALQNLVRAAEVRPEHIVADLGVIELASQTLVHGSNAVLIYAMHEGFGVQVNIRAAFEAAQDLAFLAWSDNYDHFGCRLQVAEIIDRARAVELGKAYEVARGMEPDADKVQVQSRFEADIAVWEEHRPQAREIYMHALRTLLSDRQRRRYHWSGLTRAQMVARIQERNSIEWFREWNRSVYTFLSLGAHPSAGTGPTDVRIPESGEVSYLTPDPAERDMVEDIEVDSLIYSIRTARVGLALALRMESELSRMTDEFRVTDEELKGS